MTEAARLLAALDAAPDEAERSRLLEGVAHEVLEELHQTFAYRRMNAEIRAQLAVERAQFAAFTAKLDGCADDDARLRAIAQRDPQFLVEWSQWRQADLKEAADGYFAMLKLPGSAA